MVRNDEVFVFDYGTTPRRSEEESLAGDWSRTLAVAAAVRHVLRAEQPDIALSDPELDEEWGAVVWVEGTAVRKIAVEPVVGAPLSWAVRFEDPGGCLSFTRKRREAATFDVLKAALHRGAQLRGEEFRNPRWVARRDLREFGRLS
jgi:hypothetical protein